MNNSDLLFDDIVQLSSDYTGKSSETILGDFNEFLKSVDKHQIEHWKAHKLLTLFRQRNVYL